MTPTGKLAVSYARELLRRASDMEHQLFLHYRTRNTISVGSCAPDPLWDLVPALSERFPDMAIASELDDRLEILTERLKEGIYKIIVTTIQPEIENICCLPFMKEILYLSVTKDHPLADCKEIYLKDLKDLTLILYSKIGFWYDLCKEKMIRPNFILQEDFDQFMMLTQSSSLPYFRTNISLRRYSQKDAERVLIHILDPEANVTYYCSAFKKNGQYLPKNSADAGAAAF